MLKKMTLAEAERISTHVEERTISDRVCQQLAQDIINGDMKQGQKLSEADLATRFSISRGPLREAIRKLEGMRLVVRIPHAGARVIQLDRKIMKDLYTVREALEGIACRIAAEKMGSKEIRKLKNLLDEHEKQIEAANKQEYIQSDIDIDFHYLIAKSSENQLLLDLLSGELYQLLRMCRHRTGRITKRIDPALNQHRQIVEAIANRDGELAELLMRRHISGAWKTISKLIV